MSLIDWRIGSCGPVMNFCSIYPADDWKWALKTGLRQQGLSPWASPKAIFCSSYFPKATGGLRCNYHRQPTHHWIQLDGPRPAHTGVLLPVEPVLPGAAAHVCCGSQDACHPPRGPLHPIRQLHHPVLPLLPPRHHRLLPLSCHVSGSFPGNL